MRWQSRPAGWSASAGRRAGIRTYWCMTSSENRSPPRIKCGAGFFGVMHYSAGWIAGLVNALPRESTALFDLATKGESDKAFELYRWFLPLLRMDTAPKFVQLIKLVQQEVGMGNTRVRPPRRRLPSPG